jgi:ribonuclease-3
VKLAADLAAFSRRLGHDFAKPDLLIRALTHPSMTSDTRPSNQRLEFLGDRVLNLIMADAVFRADRAADEGQLAPRYNMLVRAETCADVARDIGLGDVLRLGRAETTTGGRRKQAILADAMEAVIAAIYLDAGFEAARTVVLRHWGARIARAEAEGRDPKTALQEWLQARGQQPPAYVEVARSGPDHAPVFTIEVRTDDGRTAQAAASAKRQAEQQAARLLLGQLETRPEAEA